MIYRIDSFIENKINPITNQEYDDSWVILILTESDGYEQFVGSVNGCAYTVKISRVKCENWMMNVGDFVSFYEENEKNIILVVSENDYTEIKNYYVGHKYNDTALRDSEPDVLIHSTSMSSWEKIKQDGKLKSWSKLKLENAVLEETPIGKILGDPDEFSDYIMFGGGVTGEIVVNSRQKGMITMDIDSEYLTGARLYFDAAKMASDGLLVRDGSHLKVKDELLLQPYLMWVATWDVIGLNSQIATPRVFAEISDRAFDEIIRK